MMATATTRASRKAASGAAKGLSQGQLVRKRFLGHTGAMVALTVFALIVLLVFSAVGWGPIPGWWKWRYDEGSAIVNDGRPTMTSLFNLGDHPFGQDRVGKDMFAMTMRGAQQSILIMIIVGVSATAIGIVVGALAGYFRGWTEAVLMRITEMIMIVPLLVLAAVVGKIAISQAQGGGQSAGIVFFGLFIGAVIWTSLARLVRAEFLSLREREFVDAARIAGASDWRIIFKHVLPNSIGVIIVNTTLLMAEAILLESALSYLGLGVQPPDVSLGRLISLNQEAFSTRPWLFWWPGLFIVLICLAINFIGDGLRDAFDPRQRKFAAGNAKSVKHPEEDETDLVPPIIRDRMPAGVVARGSAEAVPLTGDAPSGAPAASGPRSDSPIPTDTWSGFGAPPPPAEPSPQLWRPTDPPTGETWRTSDGPDEGRADGPAPSPGPGR